MSDKKVAVFGIYSTPSAFERAKDELARAGFPAADVSVLMSKSVAGAGDMGLEAATKAPEGAVAGVTTGGAIGGALGVLAGAGLLAIPGLGPFLAIGPINDRPGRIGRRRRGRRLDGRACRHGHAGVRSETL